MSGLPLDRGYLGNQTEITNSMAPSGPSIPVDYQRVMSGFFETTGIPILQGRGFQPRDTVSEGGVAVINEALANTYWKGRNPIGQRLRPADTNPWFTVIGVAKDVKQSGVDQPVGAEAYALWTSSRPTLRRLGGHLTNDDARSSEDDAAAGDTGAGDCAGGPRCRSAVPVARLREMDEVFTESIRRPRLLAQLGALRGARITPRRDRHIRRALVHGDGAPP